VPILTPLKKTNAGTDSLMAGKTENASYFLIKITKK
jgi:hypothetical protein